MKVNFNTYLQEFEHERQNLLDMFLQVFVAGNPVDYLQQQLAQLLWNMKQIKQHCEQSIIITMHGVKDGGKF